MIATAAKAKNNLCPFAIEKDMVMNCHGSKCMAWEELPPESNPNEGWYQCEVCDGVQPSPATCHSKEMKLIPPAENTEPQGYCGRLKGGQ